jgi:hypothetical protein
MGSGSKPPSATPALLLSKERAALSILRQGRFTRRRLRRRLLLPVSLVNEIILQLGQHPFEGLKRLEFHRLNCWS